MSGGKIKSARASTKLTFPDAAPSWFKRVWKGMMPRIQKYAKYAGVHVKEVHVHWHEDPRRTSCSLGEEYRGKITLCTTPTDEDTIIHEVAHIAVEGQHNEEWARLFVRMANHFLPRYKAYTAIYDAWKSYKSVAKVCPNPLENYEAQG
jgi:predicted metal-dependent hydrolase